MPESTDFQLGLECLKAQKIDEAITHLEKATVQSPEDYRGFTYLGAAYAQKGLHNRAIGSFQTALRMRPDIPSIRYNLALAYQADGLTNMAKEEFQQALRLDPSYHKAADALHSLESQHQSGGAFSHLSCARHQEEPAVGECTVCRLPVCEACKTIVNGQIVCANCAGKTR
jgi:tetratricopeptide (TPR) repeat protein